MTILDQNCPRYNQPNHARITLRDHQRTILHACIALERGELCYESGEQLWTRIGIIGDSVGAGKSYVILSLVLNDKLMPKTDDDVVDKHDMFGVFNLMHVKKLHQRRVIPTTVLVVPHGLVGQWREYIDAFFPTKQDVESNGAPEVSTLYATRRRVIDMISITSHYDLVVVSNTMYNYFVEHVQSLDERGRFRRVVFDEADSLRIPSCMDTDANMYWFVTATYRSLFTGPLSSAAVHPNSGVMNVNGFIRGTFAAIRDTFEDSDIDSIVLRNSDEYITSVISPLPDPIVEMISCRTPRSIAMLSGIVNQRIIDHLNSNDVQGAMSYISGDMVKCEQNIVTMLVANLIQQSKTLERRIAFLGQLDENDEYMHEERRLRDKLSRIEQQILMIRDRIKSTNTCMICYESIDSKTVVPCCSNAFCFQCISRWVATKSSCPLCKSPASINGMYMVDRSLEEGGLQTPTSVCNNDSSSYSNGSHDKPDTLNNLLHTFDLLSGERKVLIFCLFDGPLQKIAAEVAQAGTKCAMLKGNGANVDRIVRVYKTTANLNLLIANGRYFGSGINLENTTDIIMFHKFDNAIEKQVIGRAQRPGRTAPLHIWYLLYDGERN